MPFNDEDYIEDDDPCAVEVAYRCPGKPLEIEMEGELAYMVEPDGCFVGGRFANGQRIAVFSFRTRRAADAFRTYVSGRFPAATCLLHPEL
ncbi:MAG TPA: hypothetical protein VF624_01605 [Tepidisphaeraceae bacterium]|jgi:hypothetical protein